MSKGEMLYLGLVMVAFVGFALTLAIQTALDDRVRKH